jgi:hypothetical protein
VTKEGLEDPTAFKSVYFDQKAVYHLKNYKYIGEDQGYMYKYFYGPFANWLVNYVPTYVA